MIGEFFCNFEVGKRIPNYKSKSGSNKNKVNLTTFLYKVSCHSQSKNKITKWQKYKLYQSLHS